MTYLGLASIGPPLLYAISQWELHGEEPLGERAGCGGCFRCRCLC